MLINKKKSFANKQFNVIVDLSWEYEVPLSVSSRPYIVFP